MVFFTLSSVRCSVLTNLFTDRLVHVRCETYCSARLFVNAQTVGISLSCLPYSPLPSSLTHPLTHSLTHSHSYDPVLLPVRLPPLVATLPSEPLSGPLADIVPLWMRLPAGDAGSAAPATGRTGASGERAATDCSGRHVTRTGLVYEFKIIELVKRLSSFRDPWTDLMNPYWNAAGRANGSGGGGSVWRVQQRPGSESGRNGPQQARTPTGSDSSWQVGCICFQSALCIGPCVGSVAMHLNA
jgi:hypothetical protein